MASLSVNLVISYLTIADVQSTPCSVVKRATKVAHNGYCGHCQHDDRLPLSCGHRHCPQCQQRTTSDWLERQQSKLLPVHYFMVTFTLPYELRLLARRQPKALYQSMFSVAASVLKDFAKRRNGGEIGFTPVLHTHSRQRNLHPH